MFEPLDPNPRIKTSRAVELALAAVVGIALVGFVVGIRQGTPIPELVPPAVNADASDSATIVTRATAYRDYDRRKLGPNRNWTSNLRDLNPLPVDLMADYSTKPRREVSEQQRTLYITQRMQRRAFDGAPPMVPHPIDQMNTSSCLACHLKGLSLGHGVHAPQMSHLTYASCTQCHAEGTAIEFAYLPPSGNQFQGLWLTGVGSRAYEGAPPTIPHPTWMRENCLSCHGVAGPNPIRTSHPWRISCTQCHPPSAAFDQVFTYSIDNALP